MKAQKNSELNFSINRIKKDSIKSQGILDAMIYPIILLDKKTNSILEANDAACALYGYTHDEMLKLKVTDISAEPKETTQTIQERILTKPSRYHIKKDGTFFPVEITTKEYIYKKRNVFLTFVCDICNQKKVNEERLFNQNIINCISSGIIVLDRELCYKMWNPYMEKLSGFFCSKGYGAPCSGGLSFPAG